MEKTLSYCKMILLSVCPCIAVVPELADDTTDALGAQVLECMRMWEGLVEIQSWNWAMLRVNIESLDRPDCANLELNSLPWKLLLKQSAYVVKRCCLGNTAALHLALMTLPV